MLNKNDEKLALEPFIIENNERNTTNVSAGWILPNGGKGRVGKHSPWIGGDGTRDGRQVVGRVCN